MYLDKQQRNVLFLVVQQEGFDPRDFHVEHDEKHWLLQHRSWGDSFELRNGLIGVMIESKVGEAESRLLPLMAISAAGPVLRSWLQQIRADQETPDLWAQLDNERKISELAEGQENTLFTPHEQEQIEETIAEALRQARETYDLPEPELRLLEAKLDYSLRPPNTPGGSTG